MGNFSQVCRRVFRFAHWFAKWKLVVIERDMCLRRAHSSNPRLHRIPRHEFSRRYAREVESFGRPQRRERKHHDKQRKATRRRRNHYRHHRQRNENKTKPSIFHTHTQKKKKRKERKGKEKKSGKQGAFLQLLASPRKKR